MNQRRWQAAGFGLAISALGLVIACSGDDGGQTSQLTPGAGGMGGASSGDGGSGTGTGGDETSVAAGASCTNLECQQVSCPAGQTTTLTGTVYDPSGTLPLYNALVYVPNAPLDPIADGVSCDCEVSGDPLVHTTTDESGKFVLENVPVGEDIPVVISIGKWRREITIPSVTECTENPITDVEQTSLPSNQGEGHIPRIALTTGGADPLECLLRKIGIDEEEFTLSNGTGRVNLFQGDGGSGEYSGSLNGGASLEEAQAFWSSLDNLLQYDVVLLACEGSQNPGQKPMQSREAMRDYANAGGRLFLSHWHNVWLEQGPAPWPATAQWDFESDPPMPYTGVVDQTFPKGEAMAEWLVNVGASSVPGELPISEPQHTIQGVDTGNVQPWITGKAPDTGSVKYFTFNTPIAAPDEELCGRVVFSDIHVSSGDDTGDPFPEGCTTSGLSPQEKALVFMLFDLSSCITPDDEEPLPPVQ